MIPPVTPAASSHDTPVASDPLALGEFTVETFADFALLIYVLVDTVWPHVAVHDHRPGPAPICSDPELVTMLLVGSCCGWQTDTELVCRWAAHRDLFPQQPERTRLGRRRRDLTAAIAAVRRLLTQACPLSADTQCVIDGVPVPVLHFSHVPRGNRATWQAAGATFGWVASKQERLFGYKLVVLATLNGLILDYALIPANVAEVAVAEAMLWTYPGRTVVADKGYVSAPVAAHLAADGVTLLTPGRANQRDRPTPAERAVQRRVRARIETVNSQLAEQFAIERIRAYSFTGLAARLTTKLTAHVLCVVANWLLGHPDPLQIKHLAYPAPTHN